MLSHEKLHFVTEVLVDLLWDHHPLSAEVRGEVTFLRGLGLQFQFITWQLQLGVLSFPWASAPTGLVWGFLTPWYGLLLVFGMWLTLGGNLLVGRLGKVPSCKASLSLAAFHHPETVAPSPGSQLALPIEIKSARKQEPWMCALSSLVAINHWHSPARTAKGDTANKQFAWLEQHEALCLW